MTWDPLVAANINGVQYADDHYPLVCAEVRSSVLVQALNFDGPESQHCAGNIILLELRPTMSWYNVYM